MASSGSISSLSTSLSGKELTVEIEASVSGDLGTWVSKASCSVGRDVAGGGSVGSKFYLVGGAPNAGGTTKVTEIYDPSTNSWSTGADMTTGKRDGGSCVYGTKVYYLSGLTSDWSSLNSACLVYDTSSNSWSSIADIPTARAWFFADGYNNKLYAIGGHNGSTVINANNIYDVSSNSWSSGANMTTARRGAGVTAYSGNVYVVGGLNTSGNPLSTVEMYSISNNSWSSKTGLNTARATITSLLYNRIYAVDGELGGGTNSAVVEEYNIANNSWANKTSDLTARRNVVSGAIGDKIYAVTGYASTYSKINNQFTPEGYVTLTISSISQTVALSQSSSITLDVSSLSSGSYTLTVRLYDSAGTLLDTKTTNVLIVTKYDIQASGLLAINSSSAISPFTQVSAQAIYKVNSLSLPNMIALTQAVGNTTFSVSVVSVPIEELITRGQILLSSSSIAQAVEGVMVIGGILLSSSSIAQVVDNITTTSDASFSSLSFYDSTCPIIARGLFILSSINGVGYFTETRATALSDFTSLSREQYIVQTSASGEIMHLSVSNINGLSYMFGLGTFSSSSMLQENLVVCLYSSEETLPILVTSSNVSQVIDNTAASGDVSFNSSVFSNCASLFASQGDFVFVSQGLISQVSEIQSIGLIENLSSPICQYVVQTLSSGQSLFNSQSAVNEFAPIYSMSKIALSTLLNENILANIHSASTISFSGIMSPNLFTCASFSGSFTTEATSIQELIYPTYSEGYTMFISNATINRTTEAKSAGIMTLHNTLLEQYVYGCRSIGIVLFIVSQKVVFCANALSNGHFTFTTLANPVIGKSLLVQDKVFLRTQSDTIGVHIKDDIVSVRLIPDDIAPKEVSK